MQSLTPVCNLHDQGKSNINFTAIHIALYYFTREKIQKVNSGLLENPKVVSWRCHAKMHNYIPLMKINSTQKSWVDTSYCLKKVDLTICEYVHILLGEGQSTQFLKWYILCTASCWNFTPTWLKCCYRKTSSHNILRHDLPKQQKQQNVDYHILLLLCAITSLPVVFIFFISTNRQA